MIMALILQAPQPDGEVNWVGIGIALVVIAFALFALSRMR